MGFVMEFDVRNNILRVTIVGRLTDAILSDCYATIARDVASHPPCRGILDFSEVTNLEVSSDTIRQVAAAPPAFPTGYMRILVAPKALIYGMARMFQMLGEKTRPDLHVVHSIDEAYLLLQVESPEFGPVS
jgi:hypothetical protein